MFIRHPKEQILINAFDYAEIKCCTVNLTHVDFYKEVLAKGVERGEPHFIIEFADQAERDAWFEELSQAIGAVG